MMLEMRKRATVVRLRYRRKTGISYLPVVSVGRNLRQFLLGLLEWRSRRRMYNLFIHVRVCMYSPKVVSY